MKLIRSLPLLNLPSVRAPALVSALGLAEPATGGPHGSAPAIRSPAPAHSSRTPPHSCSQHPPGEFWALPLGLQFGLDPSYLCNISLCGSSGLHLRNQMHAVRVGVACLGEMHFVPRPVGT